MNKKYIIYIGFTLLILLPTICIADPALMVTNFSLEPEILMPGDEAELTITLTNTESTATHTDTDYINSLAVDQIIETISASIDKVWINSDGDGTNSINSDKSYLDIGDLAPSSSITLSFKLTTDKNITQGLYYPIIRVDVDTYNDVKYPFPLRIDNQTLNLLYENVPSKISIGGSTDISFKIINKRKNMVDNIMLSLDNSSDFSCNPYSNYLGSLDAGESEEIQFCITPTEIGDKYLVLNLSYSNGNNQHYEIHSIPIEVIEILDVAPILTDIPYSIKKGSSSRIGLEVYNAKTESITGVIITPISDATVIPSQYFIGSMDADDVFSASFDVYTDKLNYGNHSIEFKVSYKQSGNYYETPAIDHNFIVTSEHGTSYQSSSNNNDIDATSLNDEFFNTCLIIIGVIIVIVVIFILWKWKKGRKNK